MKVEERMRLILTAPEEQLTAIDNILIDGKIEKTVVDATLLNFAEAAKKLRVSRQTIWRMVNEGRLDVVKLRENSYRIPLVTINELIQQRSVK